MASIYDVAQRCGLSTATVSRVLNNSGKVSSTAAQKVREAMRELDYSANQMARDLATRSSHTIGLLVDDAFFTASLYVLQCIQGIQQVLHPAGYCIALLPTSECTAEICQEYIKSRRIEGILALSEFTARHVLAKLSQQPGCPVGYIGAPQPDYACNVYGGYASYTCDILKRFAAFGHQQVLAFFLSDAHEAAIRERIREEDGCLYPQVVDLRQVRETVEYGRGEAVIFIAKQAIADGTTAILCTNIRDAGYVLSLCTQSGLRIPHDLSLVTVEHCRGEADCLSIPVDSFQLPTFQMGQEIARLLLERIQGGTDTSRVELTGRYIERGSVAFASAK